MTVPDAAARFGVPYAQPMSTPSCIRPQRSPKPLTTTPSHGQMNPAADGCPVPVGPAPCCAAWIRAAPCELLDRCETVAVPGKPISRRARLVGSRADHGDGRRLETPRADGGLALGGGRDSGFLHLSGNAPILRTYPRQQLDAVDDLVEARR